MLDSLLDVMVNVVSKMDAVSPLAVSVFQWSFCSFLSVLYLVLVCYAMLYVVMSSIGLDILSQVLMSVNESLRSRQVRHAS